MKRNPRYVRYADENGDMRDGVIVAENGNLSYIVDDETGNGDWFSPSEWGPS